MDRRQAQREWRRTAFTFLLAAVAGAVDGAGFLLLARYFVAHATGNSVHFALSIAEADWPMVAGYATVLGFFILGIATGAVLMHHAVRRARLPALTVGLSVEFGLLSITLIIGLLVTHNAGLPRLPPPALLLSIAPAALAMGFQNSIIRDEQWRSVHTTYITGVLVTAVEEAVELAFRGSARGQGRSDFPPEPSTGRLLLFGGVFICYMAAALVAALIERRVHFWAFALPLTGLVVALVWDRLSPFYI